MKQFFISFNFLFLLFSIKAIPVSGTNLYPEVLTNVPPGRTDSTFHFLENTKDDSTKIKLLNKLSRQRVNTGSYEEAIEYSQKAQELAEKLGFKMGLGDAYSNIGVAYWYLGANEKALENHWKALVIRKGINDKQGYAGSYNNIGLVYLNENNYEKALENYFKSLKIKEEINDIKGMANSYNNIGVIYLKQKKYDSALEIFTKSLKICEEIADSKGIAMANGNIGLVYFGKNNLTKSLDSQLKSLKAREKIGDRLGMTLALTNIAGIYINQSDYRMAMDIYFKGLKIDKEISSVHGEAVSYSNIGACYLQMGDYEKSFQYLSKASDLCIKLRNNALLNDVYYSLSDLFNRKGDYKKAFTYQKLYADLKDTILSAESNKQLTEMNSKYESEKKDKELINKDAEIAKQQADGEKELILRNASFMGFTLLFILAFFIFRGYRQKQKANKLLDEKNKKITDSINYAKRIQDSILPPLNEIKEYLPESFVFFQPKDIVSGDFYWFSPCPASVQNEESKSKEKILIAAVDCTGHGVPGAFMSMMGYNLLEQVVKKSHIHQPAKVLNALSKLVEESLRQNNQIGNINNGMDMAILSLSRDAEKTSAEKPENIPLYNHLEYAGANNSLYLVRAGALHETKADKASIGILLNKEFCFTNHNIKLEKGDCCYIFSDGFVDQFGGQNHEKFYYQPFRELLTEIHQLSMEEQKLSLESVITEWKGNNVQIDDMLVIGFRV